MQVIKTISELRQEISQHKQQGKTIALVATMGNLHEGHLALIDVAKKHADFVVSSIFVNPAQFGENEDFDSYPRTLSDDQQKLKDRNCDILFLPDTKTMYPKGNRSSIISSVHVPVITDGLCGKSRPDFFDGVSIAVSKLFNIVLPDVAIFGEKDFQQLAVVRAFTTDLNFPVKIIGAPTHREKNGLAMSSRNTYLSDEEKSHAAEIYTLLLTLKNDILAGNRDYLALQEAAVGQLASKGFKVDYISIINAVDFKQAAAEDSKIVILIAALLNGIRLIDNIQIEISN